VSINKGFITSGSPHEGFRFGPSNTWFRQCRAPGSGDCASSHWYRRGAGDWMSERVRSAAAADILAQPPRPGGRGSASRSKCGGGRNPDQGPTHHTRRKSIAKDHRGSALDLRKSSCLEIPRPFSCRTWPGAVGARLRATMPRSRLRASPASGLLRQDACRQQPSVSEFRQSCTRLNR